MPEPTKEEAMTWYKIADLLKANNTCAAVWADWYVGLCGYG